MKNIKYALIISFAFISVLLTAQTEPGYTHFSFNKLAYNPAYAGLEGAMNLTGIYRKQWLNFDNAPSTAVFNLHTPLFSDKAGIGLGLVHDVLGLTSHNNIDISYAYHIKLNDDIKLSLGVAAAFQQYRLNWTKAQLTDADDDYIGVNNTEKYQGINFGTGLMLTHKNYYFGISMPRLLKNPLYQVLESANKYEKPLYLNAGTRFQLSPKMGLEVNLLGTYMQNAPFDIDVNAIVMFNKVFGVGAAYRLDDSFDFLVRIKPTKQFVISAAYDYTTSDLNKVSNGSVELLLSYLFSFEKKDVLNFRFF
ncbi:MAG: type IX secretion system membrane protein PorP/SprF [Saprospiraceae bacterium]|nr:type IX secretion system membrane protein PorP/SprF [Saprospiraceae bacterium]